MNRALKGNFSKKIEKPKVVRGIEWIRLNLLES